MPFIPCYRIDSKIMYQLNKICVDILRSIVRKIFNSGTQCEPFNDVLFYGSNHEDNSKQIGLTNLFCVHYIIIQASKSIDVCMPSLTSETIAKSLIAVQQKKIKIRVTIHNSDDYRNLQSFAQHGIEVKVINATERMEHEFILIDACDGYEDALAVIGSLDYETTRVNCNRDTTMFVSEKVVVTTLKKEFDRIWYNVDHN